jgi:hypothetical protein
MAVACHCVLRALPGALDALHRDFPDDPIVMMGDFNMPMTELQIQMGSWDLPFWVLQIRGGRRQIVMEEKETKDEVASSNYWQPLAESMEKEVAEALECTQALTDLAMSHQDRLDGMAKKFMDTCHTIVDQLDIHQKVGGKAPPRVAARVRRAIEQRWQIFRELQHAESQGDHASVARIGEEYHTAQAKARKVIRITGCWSWHKTIQEAHVNMREQPCYYWRWASATAGWRQKNSAAGIQPVLGPDGCLLTALADIHQAWGEHDASLAVDETGPCQDTQHWEFLDPHPQRNVWICYVPCFSSSEIWQALKKMKAHCAPGGDGIPTELLKASCLVEQRAVDVHLAHEQDNNPTPPPSTPMTASLGTLLNFAFEEGIVAETWAESLVVSIPKKGNLANMNNYWDNGHFISV